VEVRRQGGIVKKTLSVIGSVAGVASLLLAGYVFLKSIPDLRRYIKISTM
jgi:hypothetical protein